MVPLYDVFCEVTGLGGKTSAHCATAQLDVAAWIHDRTVRVEFVASVRAARRGSSRRSIDASRRASGQALRGPLCAHATNRRGARRAGRAEHRAGRARLSTSSKTECFCFTSQAFGADESRDAQGRVHGRPQAADGDRDAVARATRCCDRSTAMRTRRVTSPAYDPLTRTRRSRPLLRTPRHPLADLRARSACSRCSAARRCGSTDAHRSGLDHAASAIAIVIVMLFGWFGTVIGENERGLYN